MQTNDNESFRTKESAFKQFRRTCLGKIVILGAVIVFLLIIAFFTNPSSQRMQREMWDNIRQSIESDDPSELDAIDVFINNIGYTFSSADSVENKEVCALWRATEDFHDTVFHRGAFWTTMEVRTGVEPECCGIGIFGLVIPTANFKRFIPKDAPRGEYGEQLIQQSTEPEELFGDTPVDIFRYEGE